MAKQQTDLKVVDRLGDEPLVLMGAPDALRGALYLSNAGKQPVVLHQGELLYAPVHSKTKKPPMISVTVPLSAVLQPGQSQRVKIRLDLGPHSPPCEYHGTLKVGEYSRSVVLHVTEVVRLEISPETMVIDQRAGATVVKQVVLTNRGNVPLTIGELGRVPLGQEVMPRWSLQTTLAATGESPNELEALFAEITGEEAQPTLKPAGFLEVYNTAGRVVLQPGQVCPLDLEICLPDALENNARYLGQLPLYTSDLHFVIVPGSGDKRRKLKKTKDHSPGP